MKTDDVTLTNRELRYLVRISSLVNGEIEKWVDLDMVFRRRDTDLLNVIRGLRAKEIINVHLENNIISKVALNKRCRFLVVGSQ